MSPRKPMSHAEQLVRLKRYLRRSRTELRHRYDELFESTKGRRDCPFEVSVRRRVVRQFEDTVGLLEACLEELQRQEALFYAPFKPGDCIAFERDVNGTRTLSGPYIVVDVLPDKRTRYSYDCVALTKDGAMFKRAGSARVSPDASTIVMASSVSLNDTGRREAEYFRRCVHTSHQLAFLNGDVTLFEALKDWLGTPHYRRKNRLDP